MQAGQIWHDQRTTIKSEQNRAYKEVTNYAKPWERSYVSHNASEGIQPRNIPCCIRSRVSVQANCHQGLKSLNDLIMSQLVNLNVEADIKGFFDNVSHEREGLMEFIHIRIKDMSLLNLINKFLKVGYVENEELIKTNAGTPQDSILSPTLANIFDEQGAI